MASVSAFCAAWSLIWALWSFGVAAARPPRWLDELGAARRDGALFAVNAIACAVGGLAAWMVR